MNIPILYKWNTGVDSMPIIPFNQCYVPHALPNAWPNDNDYADDRIRVMWSEFRYSEPHNDIKIISMDNN